jgi:CheY-like chemotaxis protein
MSKVLVIEDEANVRKLVAVNLISRGYSVLEAASAQQALTYLPAAAPDLLVLDIKLPDLTGWELLRRVAADGSLDRKIPILIMTASIMDAHAADPQRYANPIEILIKPFSVDQLIAAVQRGLRAANQREESHGSSSSH